MRIGIIGTGNMGGMLAKAYADCCIGEIFVYNRSHLKADRLAEGYPSMHVCSNVRDVIRMSEFVFLCTKANDGRALVGEVGRLMTANQVLLTTISSIPVDEWSSLTEADVVKLIPSLTQTAHKGILLVNFGRRTSQRRCQDVLAVLAEIGTPAVIADNQVRVSSDLTSCGPAFLAYILQMWARAATDTGAVDSETAVFMLRETVCGLAGLLDNGMTFADILQRIAVPGGVTEQGLQSLADMPYEMFRRLHDATKSFSHGVTTAPARLGAND